MSDLNTTTNDEELHTREFEPLASEPLLNRTDPIVRHDPTVQANVVVKEYTELAPMEGKGNTKNEADLKRVEGPFIPIVRVGNLVIKFSNILYMNIDYDAFVPSIVLKIQQLDRDGEIAEVPGMTCDMTVVLTPHVDGAYKPINLTFYVRDIRYESNSITYYGVYKCMKADEPMTKQVVFPGCPAEKCQLPQNNKPTTFEFLHTAAVEDLGLGLAATKQVKEIKDNKTRILHAESYFDAIQKHVAFGGLDEESIFDCWIDLYRYLVIVNVPWVLNEDVKFNEIGYHAEEGLDLTDSKVGSSNTETTMVHRIITNNKSLPSTSNITFRNYSFIVDNERIQDEGAIASPVITKPVSTGGNDGCDQTDVKIQEGSIDGTSLASEYSYRKQEYLGPEYGDDENTPILNSKVLHDSYFRKLRAKRLKIEMETPNLGLQRGTLVTVMVYEYNNVNKRYMLAHNPSAFETNATDDEGPKITTEDTRDIDNDGQGFLNTSVTGMYYIDGMSFEYNIKYQKFVQFLYLVRKGMMPNMSNIENKPKVSLSQEQ